MHFVLQRAGRIATSLSSEFAERTGVQQGCGAGSIERGRKCANLVSMEGRDETGWEMVEFLNGGNFQFQSLEVINRVAIWKSIVSRFSVFHRGPEQKNQNFVALPQYDRAVFMEISLNIGNFAKFTWKYCLITDDFDDSFSHSDPMNRA